MRRILLLGFLLSWTAPAHAGNGLRLDKVMGKQLRSKSVSGLTRIHIGKEEGAGFVVRAGTGGGRFFPKTDAKGRRYYELPHGYYQDPKLAAGFEIIAPGEKSIFATPKP